MIEDIRTHDHYECKINSSVLMLQWMEGDILNHECDSLRNYRNTFLPQGLSEPSHGTNRVRTVPTVSEHCQNPHTSYQPPTADEFQQKLRVNSIY